MNCYMCGSDQELSPRNYNKGSISFICRPCRRAEQEEKGYTRDRKQSQITAEKEWRRMAREKNGAIARKYASINQRTQQ